MVGGELVYFALFYCLSRVGLECVSLRRFSFLFLRLALVVHARRGCMVVNRVRGLPFDCVPDGEPTRVPVNTIARGEGVGVVKVTCLSAEAFVCVCVCVCVLILLVCVCVLFSCFFCVFLFFLFVRVCAYVCVYMCVCVCFVCCVFQGRPCWRHTRQMMQWATQSGSQDRCG